MRLAISALRFDPTIPLWALGVLAALCMVAVAAGPVAPGARQPAARSLCFAVVLLWLAGPRLVQETREALNDIAVMVVDRTGSMARSAAAPPWWTPPPPSCRPRWRRSCRHGAAHRDGAGGGA